MIPSNILPKKLSGSKSGSRFFSDKGEDIRKFEPATAPMVPRWPFLTPMALFLCHAPALNYKLTGCVAVTEGKPDFRESNYGGQCPPYSVLVAQPFQAVHG
jgi:hypothetical protein